LGTIWAVSIIASILILGILGLSTQSHAATINDNVIVGAGQTLALDGDTINGNVELNGGSIDFADVIVNGNVIAENCIGENTIEGGAINGNIILEACNDITVNASIINGNVEVNDSNNVVFSANEINGNITIENPTGCNVFDNDVNGNLEIGECSTEPPDTEPPIITASTDPLPNANGWNNSNVLITFGCVDNEGGSGVASLTGPIIVTTEGANQQFPGTCTDNAGNSAIVTVTVNLDKTPPNITASTSPAPNANGWNSSDVTVSFNCGDALSGIFSLTPDVTVQAEGQNQLVLGTCIDIAGNSATVTVTVSLDKTPPIMNATTDPLPNANGWNNSNVLISFECFDALSGAVSVTAPIPVTTEGANQQFTGTCADFAGNSATATVTVNIDKTAVEPIITNPFDGAVLTNNLPTISGTAESNDSITILVDGVELATSVSPDGTGFWTITLSEALADGGHTFSARSNDLAGNASSLDLVAVFIDTTP